MSSHQSLINILLFLLLVIALGYFIDLKNAYGLAQSNRSLVIRLSDIGSDAVLFNESAKNDNKNSVCSDFLQPFLNFYDDIFIPFMKEHRVRRFRNLTEEHVDSLRSEFDLTRHVWNSCVSHSKEVSDPSQLADHIFEDRISFIINRLREHGITEKALEVLEQILEFQQTFLSSDNIRCQDEIRESYTDMIGKYDLRSILLINRRQRSHVIEERGRVDFNAVKTKWDICIN